MFKIDIFRKNYKNLLSCLSYSYISMPYMPCLAANPQHDNCCCHSLLNIISITITNTNGNGNDVAAILCSTTFCQPATQEFFLILRPSENKTHFFHRLIFQFCSVHPHFAPMVASSMKSKVERSRAKLMAG